MNLHLLLPEVLVLVAALAVVSADLLLPAARRPSSAPALAALGFAAALVALLLDRRTGTALAGAFRADGFAWFARLLAAGGGLLVTGVAAGYTRRMDRGHGEMYALLMIATLGVMLVSAVGDLMSLFVSLELVTVTSYVLAAFKRNDARSTEAGLKYLVIGAVSSAVLLFGIALVYGATGSVSFGTISAHLAAKGAGPLVTLGTALVFAGLFFKAAAVPFQVWAPDVYQGAPTPVTAFLSSLSKSAGFVLLLRMTTVLVLPVSGSSEAPAWAGFLAVIAVLTLLYGNLGAIPQRDVKRLLAYSSIGHAGYLMMGIAAVAAAGGPVGGTDAAASVLLYLLAYYPTTITAFAVVSVVSATSGGRHDAPEHYVGLARRNPFLGLAMLFALLSLAGVPPMAGLIGKLLVFRSTVDVGLYALALVGAASVVVSLYFYLVLIKQMYVRSGPKDAVPVPVSLPARLAMSAGIAAVLVLGIWWDPAWRAAHEAAAALFAAR